MENLHKDSHNEELAPIMSLKDWVISIIITCIPVIGFVMLIIWAFASENINKNKKNWAKGFLIVQVIGIILAIIFYVFIITSAFAFYKINTTS